MSRPILNRFWTMPLAKTCKTNEPTTLMRSMARLYSSFAISCNSVHTTWVAMSAAWAPKRMRTPTMSVMTSIRGWMGRVPMSDSPVNACRRRACAVDMTIAVPFWMTFEPSASTAPRSDAYFACTAHHPALPAEPSQTWPWKPDVSLMMPPYPLPVNTRLTTSSTIKIVG